MKETQARYSIEIQELESPEITRRKLLWLLSGAAVGIGLGLTGCGGGGGGNAGGLTATMGLKGSVTLPAGIKNSALQVMTGVGTSPVGSTEQFTASIVGSGPQNVYLFDSAGNLLLAGPLRPGRSTLSSRSMAEFLAFHAIGAFSHTGDISAAVWTLLETADLTAIQTAIEQAISASGNTWGTKAQPQLTAALQTFSQSILPPVAKSAAITVDPTDRLSGIQLTTDDIQTCTATNDFRRRAWLYGTPVSYLDSSGKTQTLPVSLTSVEIPPTNGITSVLTSLAQFAGGTTFYTQTSVTVSTPMTVPTATSETYQLWAVGPAGTAGSWTGVPSQVNTGWWEVTGISIVVDYLIPWLTNLLFPLAADKINGVLSDLNQAIAGTGVSDLSAPLKDVLNILAGDFTIQQEAFNGDLGGALWDSALLIANSDTFKIACVKLLAVIAEHLGALSQNDTETLYRSVASLLTALDFGASVFDAAVQIADLASSKTIETWTVTVTPPKLNITPANPTIPFGDTPTFTATLVGSSGSDTVITYDWTLTGPGTLQNGKSGATGTSVSTSANTVNYLAPQDDTKGTTATLSVSAYYQGVSNPNRQLIATASTTITLQNQPYVIETFTADDELTLKLNGKVIYQDPTGSYAGSRGPFTLTGAKAGDTVEVICQDYYGFYYGHSAIQLMLPNGKEVQALAENYPQVPDGEAGQVRTDETFTLPAVLKGEPRHNLGGNQ